MRKQIIFVLIFAIVLNVSACSSIKQESGNTADSLSEQTINILNCLADSDSFSLERIEKNFTGDNWSKSVEDFTIIGGVGPSYKAVVYTFSGSGWTGQVGDCKYNTFRKIMLETADVQERMDGTIGVKLVPNKSSLSVGFQVVGYDEAVKAYETVQQSFKSKYDIQDCGRDTNYWTTTVATDKEELTLLTMSRSSDEGSGTFYITAIDYYQPKI